MKRFRGNLWLDGVIASLAVAALGAAVIFDEVLSTTGGSALVVATNLAYPLADLLLLALVVAMFGLTGWRVDRTWGLVAAGFAVFAIADSVYLYKTAVGHVRRGRAPGRRLARGARPDRLLGLAADDEAPGRPHRELAGADAAHVLRGRRARAPRLRPFRPHQRARRRARLGHDRRGDRARGADVPRARPAAGEPASEEALTDSLTGLGNRRRFVADVEDAPRRGGLGHPFSLIVFDLDGFKTYNDSFGHAAGDALLARVAGRLADAIEGHGAPTGWAETSSASSPPRRRLGRAA